jgi:hypothetical protein
MKFSANQDLDIPQFELFDRLSNFESFERQAIRRGVSVSRQGSLVSMSGLKWNCSFKLRGRQRTALIELVEFEQGHSMSFYVVNASMNIPVLLDLSALSVNQTRLIATSVLEAKTLAARLLVQSLKLTRSKANRRYQSRLSQITNMIVQNA